VSLAYAQLQAGQRDSARKTLIMGVWRTRGQVRMWDALPPPGDPFPEGATFRRPIGEVFDLSAGNPGSFPAFPHARSAAEFPEASARMAAISEAATRLLSQATQSPGPVVEEHKNIAQAYAFETYLLAGNQMEYVTTAHAGDRPDDIPDPDMRREATALWDAFQRFNDRVAKAHERAAQEMASISDNSRCGEHLRIADRAMAASDAAFTDFEKAYRQMFAFAHHRATGIAANIADPAWHQAAIADITKWSAMSILNLFTMATGAYVVVGYAGDCIGPQAKADSTDVAASDAARCSPFLRGVSIKFSTKFSKGTGLPAFSTKIDCEKVTTEISGPGWIGPYVAADWTPKGKLTLTGGIKATPPVDILPFTATGKVGVYVTATSEGITDGGIKGSVSSDAKVGPVAVSATGVEGKLSVSEIGFDPAGAAGVLQDAVLYWAPRE
jgi:hypothetical protein